jgi:HlyD family secretion protein
MQALVTSRLVVLFGVVFLAAQDDKGQAVVCQVEKGGMTLSLLPERSLVKKGDVICELDSADLKDRLIEQTIAAKRAEIEYQTSRLAHELAMLASKQYTESTYLLDRAAIQGEIKRAESNMTSAADQLDHTTRGFEKGMVTKAQKIAAELTFQRTRFDLELAQSKLNSLENYSKPMAVKRALSEVEKTRSHELAAKEIWDLRQGQVERTRRNIENCRLKAPCDGRLVYATRLARTGEGADPVPIQPGDIVRERQELARVIPQDR